MARASEVFTLGHSPDPDDAFMFYAMAENKIDLRGYRFEHRLEDIQTLNERAMRGELHLRQSRFTPTPMSSERYALLPCGASMGDGYGPMMVASEAPIAQVRTPNGVVRDWLRGHDRGSGEDDERVSRAAVFSRRVRSRRGAVRPDFRCGEARRSGCGLIIHEGQLTYARSGFSKIVDLGEWWKRETASAASARRKCSPQRYPRTVRRDLLEIMRESIDYGLAHREEAVRHSMPYARDMDAALASKFIGMYVNDYTRDYGEIGRAAIREFLNAGRRGGFLPERNIELDFVE